jgi:hypothetical protein
MKVNGAGELVSEYSSSPSARMKHDMPTSPVAEVYPALRNRTFPSAGRTPDQQDAFATAEWLRRADTDGSLQKSSGLSLNHTSARRPGLRAGFSEFCSVLKTAPNEVIALEVQMPLGLFLFAVFVITAGDALFRHLQRNQIKRELEKIGAPLVAICLSVSLLTSQLAFAQTAPPPQKATPEVQYQRLFKAVNLLVKRLKDVCKTEECAALVTEETALIADAQEKQKKGSLVNDERIQFHKNLDSLLIRVKTALVAVDAERDNGAARLRIPQRPAHSAGKPGVKTIVYDQDRCDLCYQVLKRPQRYVRSILESVRRAR